MDDKSVMQIQGIAAAGMERAHAKLESEARRIAGGAAPATVDPQTGSPAGDFVALVESRNEFQTCANAYKTADELIQATLSLLA